MTARRPKIPAEEMAWLLWDAPDADMRAALAKLPTDEIKRPKAAELVRALELLYLALACGREMPAGFRERMADVLLDALRSVRTRPSGGKPGDFKLDPGVERAMQTVEMEYRAHELLSEPVEGRYRTQNEVVEILEKEYPNTRYGKPRDGSARWTMDLVRKVAKNVRK